MLSLELNQSLESHFEYEVRMLSEEFSTIKNNC